MNKVKQYKAENEPVLGYKAGSKERNDVDAELVTPYS